jgi:Cytochrome domain of cellobiose dehydrogenase/Eukaryotic cytochrome b561
VTISINVPSDTSDDIFFHVSAPAGQAWVGFGFGTEMKDALIFVSYKSQDGKNVTISPRIGHGHDEPKYTHAIGVNVLQGTFVDNETYNINGQCTGCRSWPLTSGRQGKIDVMSTTQPMIYAIGDEDPFRTNNQEAVIRQHIVYGTFNIDLKAATGEPGVPNNNATESGVTHGEESGASNLGSVFHGLFMGACFVVLFPVGALLLRLPFRFAFWLHLIWQSCTVIGVLIGFALGIYVSLKNSKSPHLNSAHQGLGIALTLLVLVQPTLGFLHHRTHKQTQSPTLGKIHRYLGPAIILIGVVNGALGLNFADNRRAIPAYFGFVLFIAIVCILAQWVLRRRAMRSNAQNSVAASNFREGTAAYEVPLENYTRQNNVSQQSFARADQAPPQYVNVMPKNEQQRMS